MNTVVQFLIELSVLAWLLWKTGSAGLLGWSEWPLVAVLVAAVFGAAEYRRLRAASPQPEPRALLVSLILLSMILSMFLAGRLTWELRIVPDQVSATKDMRWEAHLQRIPAESQAQFFQDWVESTRRERNNVVVLSAVLLLLYWRSYSSLVGATRPRKEVAPSEEQNAAPPR